MREQTKNVITCTCGARLRVPARGAGKALRCPLCRAKLNPAVEARVLESFRTRPGEKEALCPICQSAIGLQEEATVCPDCEQVHHKVCWQEVGGCSTYGCAQAPALDKGD